MSLQVNNEEGDEETMNSTKFVGIPKKDPTLAVAAAAGTTPPTPPPPAHHRLMGDDTDHLLPRTRGDHNDDHDNSAADEEEESAQPTYRSALLVTTPIFMGYSALVSFQANVKSAIGIHDNQSNASYEFGVAISFLFLAALLFRLLHNILLGFWLTPRARVILAYGLMILANAMVVFLIYVGHVTTNIALIFVIYITGGVAVGIFESNLISCITPLGHQTKKWAVLGMPLGYNGISIGGFFLFAFVPHNETLEGCVFGAIVAALLVGFATFLWVLPVRPFEASRVQGWQDFKRAFRHWREWVVPILPNIVALFVDMFACILSSSAVLYVFNVEDVPVVPHARTATLPYNAFLGIFNVCSFAGDFLSRRLVYSPPRWWPNVLRPPPSGNPLRFTILTAIGFGLTMCPVALLSPIGIFLIMFGNGLIYATSTKHIDQHISWEWNLVALSVWLFMGDWGSFIASNLTTYVSNSLGRVPGPKAVS